MDEIFEAKRKKLENAVRVSVLELFEHMNGSQAFRLPLDPPKQILFVIAGDVKSIQSMILNNSFNSEKEEADE